MSSPSRKRAAIAAGTVALVFGGALTVAQLRPAGLPPTSVVDSTSSPAPAPAPASPVASDWEPTSPPRVPREVWTSWAYLDSAEGSVSVGGNGGRGRTAGLLRPAVIADFLGTLDATGVPPTAGEERLMRTALVDSDNDAAEQIYDRGAGGGLARIGRTCDLGELAGDWRTVQLTATATASLGACLREGAIAPDVWTAWVLDRMREVRGEGRFGPIETHPMTGSRPIAISNGWEIHDGEWHVSCLAIGDWWSAAILTRYPADWGRDYGGKVCADVTAAVVPPDTETAPGISPAPSSIRA